MAWSVPRTWVAGELVTSSIMNVHVRDQFVVLDPLTRFLYAERVSDLTIAGLSEAAATTVVTLPANTFDGTTAWEVEFSCTAINAASGQLVGLALFDGGSSVGQIALVHGTGASFNLGPIKATRPRFVPGAGSRTYSIRAWVSSSTALMKAAGGGASNAMPAACFMRALPA